MAFSYRSVVYWLCPRLAINDDNSNNKAKPSMGQLALYLLALRANCEFVGGHKGDRLVSQLKRFLEDEKRAIGERTWSAKCRGGGPHQITFSREASKSELWVFSPRPLSHPPLCLSHYPPRGLGLLQSPSLIKPFLYPTCALLASSSQPP